MKKHAGMRQSLKVVRHGAKRFRIPEPKRRGAKVLGAWLPGLAGVRPMLNDLRKEFMYGMDEDGNEYALSPEEVDWSSVRVELEVRLRKIPSILPSELASFEWMVEYQKTLPRKAKFREPTTPKLRVDVRVLYKHFVKLYDLAAYSWRFLQITCIQVGLPGVSDLSSAY